MNDLELVMQVLDLDEDNAFAVLELCDVLEREDAIALHGYPKDSPRDRDLGACLADERYRQRLRELIKSEGLEIFL